MSTMRQTKEILTKMTGNQNEAKNAKKFMDVAVKEAQEGATRGESCTNRMNLPGLYKSTMWLWSPVVSWQLRLTDRVRRNQIKRWRGLRYPRLIQIVPALVIVFLLWHVLFRPTSNDFVGIEHKTFDPEVTKPATSGQKNDENAGEEDTIPTHKHDELSYKRSKLRESNDICFIVRTDSRMESSALTFMNVVYNWETDRSVSIEFLVSDKISRDADKTEQYLKRAINAIRRYYNRYEHRHPRFAISPLRYSQFVVKKTASKCKDGENFDDFGYAITDLALEQSLSDTNSYDGGYRCSHVVVTNIDNFYSKYFLKAVEKRLDTHDLIGVNFISHHIWGYSTNVPKKFEYKHGHLDLGSVIMRGHLLRSFPNIRYCSSGVWGKDMHSADGHMVTQLARIGGVKKQIVDETLFVHQ
mmetsp:Transcript_23803/g.42178  ORF Transcript_23803/g.42178 Transcript_23803/m.42178 type:complete len:413 (-) Transcript_23803:316-1554(-)